MVAKVFQCRRGVVSIEAAFVFPVLIMLVVGGLEFAMLLFTYSSMQTAAREVTRQVAVNFSTEADAEAAVAERLPAWTQAAADVAVTQSSPGAPETNVITVRVTMAASDATPLGFFTQMSGDWTLETEVAMKQELPL